MTSKILLASFLGKENLEEFLKNLDKNFSIKKDNTFIFSVNESDNFMVTYKLDSGEGFREKLKNKLKSTIQIHKKGDCFYSINGLNKLIQRDFELPEGNIEYKSYTIKWENYQNKLILVKDDILQIQDIKKVIL